MTRDVELEWLGFYQEINQMTGLNYETTEQLIKVFNRNHPGKLMRDLTVSELTECLGEALVTLYPESEARILQKRKMYSKDIVVHKIHPPHEQAPEPTLKQRINAALYLFLRSASGTGIRTKLTLTYPEHIVDDDVNQEACKFIGEILLASLEAQPPQVSQQILQDQAERLSSDDEYLRCSDKNHLKPQ
jgi:hypothetical protein